MTYSSPPPLSVLHLGKANRPNPCPATPIIHRLHTHIPPLTLLSSGREMDSYCLPECTTYLWM